MGELRMTGLDGAEIAIPDEALAAFRARLRGPIHLAGSDGHAAACNPWNGMIESRPALVVRPTGTADVVECVRFAREHGVRISPRGGGHNIAGTSLPAGGLTVDMGALRGVHVDPVRRLARVQAGCNLGDVDRETQVHGLAAPLGFVSETGVGGLTLGGGYGYLTRRFGWTVDNLEEVEIVTADGAVRRASADEHGDLFWAVRGGGGNLGIVTSFVYRLHAVGPLVHGGMIAWPVARATEVLGLVRDLGRSAPNLTLAATVRLAPPAPFLPKEVHGTPMVAAIACHTGPPDEATRDLAWLRGIGGSHVDLLAPRTYVQQQAMNDPLQPRGLCYYWKTEYLPELSDEVIEKFIRLGSGVTSPLSGMQLFHIGGAISRRAYDDGAVGNRDAAYLCSAAGAWPRTDPGADRHLAWVRAAWEALRPHGTGGTYVNFMTEDEGADRVASAYGPNLARLAAIKARYDPNNLFRANRNVAPR